MDSVTPITPDRSTRSGASFPTDQRAASRSFGILFFLLFGMQAPFLRSPEADIVAIASADDVVALVDAIHHVAGERTLRCGGGAGDLAEGRYRKPVAAGGQPAREIR